MPAAIHLSTLKSFQKSPEGGFTLQTIDNFYEPIVHGPNGAQRAIAG